MLPFELPQTGTTLIRAYLVTGAIYIVDTVNLTVNGVSRFFSNSANEGGKRFSAMCLAMCLAMCSSNRVVGVRPVFRKPPKQIIVVCLLLASRLHRPVIQPTHRTDRDCKPTRGYRSSIYPVVSVKWDLDYNRVSRKKPCTDWLRFSGEISPFSQLQAKALTLLSMVSP